jgi:hypothetical protein
MTATVAGTVPVDRPTPVLSNRMTWRPDERIGHGRLPVVQRSWEMLQTQQWTADAVTKAPVRVRFVSSL